MPTKKKPTTPAEPPKPKRNLLGRPRPNKYWTHTPWATVIKMREDFWGGMPVKEVAKKYGLSHSYTWQIVHAYRRRQPEKAYLATGRAVFPKGNVPQC